ncbi:MAG TPA: hypothetical protein VMV69_08165 [Pirellulales bacterium]|nr:hypothetical protein [Pirellulales bacterium]
MSAHEPPSLDDGNTDEVSAPRMEPEPGDPFVPSAEAYPRLSIQHLMAWTAATAVYLALKRAKK